MAWLAFGVVYTLLYLAGSALVGGRDLAFLVFRLAALVAPPLAGVAVIVRRRHAWAGCQWLFWATIALGLVTSAVGHVGWTADEILLQRSASWLGWHAVFVMFGSAAPLLALLAQPHRGTRDAAAATTSVDIAGIAVLTGFLYSYVVSAEELIGSSGQGHSATLLILSEFQPFVVTVGMIAAAIVARDTAWGATYRRLAAGLCVSFVMLTLSNVGIWEGAYQPGFVYDFTWILPMAFYPWAASHAPASAASAPEGEASDPTPSRPWVIFATLILIPVLETVFRRSAGDAALGGSRDLSTAVTVVSVLPLLLARLAVERAELRRSDDRLRLMAAAVEQADELIHILTADARFLHANDAFCRAVGYDRAALARMRAPDLLADESQGASEEADAEVRAGRIWRGTLVRRRRDGGVFTTSAAMVPLGDSRGRVTHLVSVERDITRDLELRDQLIHTERLSAVGQLVAGVAHELNNPLQSVIGYTELLMDTETDGGAREQLEQVQSEAMRAARIVRNLLSFVRRSPSARGVEDLNAVVQSAVTLRAYELQTANIVLEEEYAPDLPPVWINREQIQQVLLNLILNAEQALLSGPGRGRIVVRTTRTETGAAVDVEDDGPGIPGAIAGRVFEPFFSTKEVGQGTGLGLSIALGIAESYGGSLALRRSRSGACFRLSLPASPWGADVPQLAARPEEASTART
jgi:PAS domain S-box-containing protein